tara:strand:+ start:1946 stop:2707 length:762 start_codon:yes stop_codon:yes gene_type:complete
MLYNIIMNKLKILKMKDSTDSNVTKKNLIFDLPMRLLIISKSGDGKSSYLGNLLLRDEFYRKDFLPENIFIFTGSKHGDKKLKTIIDELDIEDSNVIDGYDEDMLDAIYDMLVDNFNEKVEDKVKDKKQLNSLIILDDLSFNNSFKDKGKNDMIRKLFMNGRKYSMSVVIISQKYSSVSTAIRENATGLIIGKSSNKQVDLINDDHNYLKSGRKEFIKLFRETTDTPYTKFIINFSNHPEIYQDQNFKPLKLE